MLYRSSLWTDNLLIAGNFTLAAMGTSGTHNSSGFVLIDLKSQCCPTPCEHGAHFDARERDLARKGRRVPKEQVS